MDTVDKVMEVKAMGEDKMDLDFNLKAQEEVVAAQMIRQSSLETSVTTSKKKISKISSQRRD